MRRHHARLTSVILEMHFALKTLDYFAGAPMPADGEEVDSPEKFREIAENLRGDREASSF